jgi:hypothetical protein
VSAVEDLRDSGLLIRHHHEAFNGAGFPDGLRGEAIPLGARIIAISDYMDRAIAKSQSTNPVDSALALLRQEAGQRLDPALVPLIESPARELYGAFIRSDAGRELELLPKDLKEGMVTVRNVVSGTGVLLLGKGITLSKTHLSALVRYFQNDPPKGGVFVSVKR